jgi:hypothetical protein
VIWLWFVEQSGGRQCLHDTEYNHLTSRGLVDASSFSGDQGNIQDKRKSHRPLQQQSAHRRQLRSWTVEVTVECLLIRRQEIG